MPFSPHFRFVVLLQFSHLINAPRRSPTGSYGRYGLDHTAVLPVWLKLAPAHILRASPTRLLPTYVKRNFLFSLHLNLSLMKRFWNVPFLFLKRLCNAPRTDTEQIQKKAKAPIWWNVCMMLISLVEWWYVTNRQCFRNRSGTFRKRRWNVTETFRRISEPLHSLSGRVWNVLPLLPVQNIPAVVNKPFFEEKWFGYSGFLVW